MRRAASCPAWKAATTSTRWAAASRPTCACWRKPEGAAMEQPLIEARDGRGVVTLTLNRPASFNALGEELLQALQSALDRLAGDASLRVLVLAATGKAFCAGHHLKEMIASPDLAYYQR